MIQIEPIGFIPDLPYAEYSWEELRKGREMLEVIEKGSKEIWLVRMGDTPVLVAGIILRSFLSPPHLWVLVCEDLTSGSVVWKLRALRDVLAQLHLRHRKLETLVEASWGKGLKFARYCGFHQTDKTLNLGEKQYLVMET